MSTETTNGAAARTAALARSAVQRSQEAATLPARTTSMSQLKALLERPDVKEKFNSVLSKQAPQFIQTLLSTCSTMYNFEGVEPSSVVNAALQAASMNLPVNPNLGYAYIIPYNVREGDKKVKKAQFQIGYLGFVQLAIRSGEYRNINYAIVYEGMLVKNDILTGEVVLDAGKKSSDKVIGYVAYIETLRGYRKFLYMTHEEMDRHARLYSKSFNKEDSLWKKSFDQMALKTVLKLLLKKWGILSIDLQNAATFDGAVVKETPLGIVPEYVDGNDAEVISTAPLAEGAAPSGPVGEKEPEPPKEEKPRPEEGELVTRIKASITTAKDKKFLAGVVKNIDMLLGEGQLTSEQHSALIQCVEEREYKMDKEKEQKAAK